ncbi:MAG: type II toxin-antitoxin system RelE/ParE family toxin [Alphaproteobacteria bacterium]|nr:type II toxin-antitoxin system RelE/ParE family toxin [Alphaproteobacteria bacterium]
MAGWQLTRLAAADLDEIGRYTQEKWGRDQRLRYLAALERRMAFLAERPDAGRKRDDVREGYKSWREGSHVIFYKSDSDSLLIVRVLHHAMDPADRL